MSTERTVKTFHARRGRLTPTRSTQLADVVPQYLLPEPASPLDLREHFGAAEVTIDFGCGMGDSTIALLTSGIPVLAMDVHTPGICRIAQWAHDHSLQNLALIHGDGIPVLESQLAANSISKFLVLFPDPWPKARHNKRRLIQSEFLDLVARLMVPTGSLIIATDDATYAEHIETVVRENKSLKLVGRSYELPDTKFGNRAIEAGRDAAIFELVPAI